MVDGLKQFFRFMGSALYAPYYVYGAHARQWISPRRSTDACLMLDHLNISQDAHRVFKQWITEHAEIPQDKHP
ncbi:hypothetical protein GC177_07265 [bacterium]|nr:hypothetical protein [bacterium]